MRAPADTISSALPEPTADQPNPIAGFAGAWARRRSQLTPWAYPRLRALAILRLTIGIFLVGLGAGMVAYGHPGWAALPLGGAALHFAIGYLDITAARVLRHS